MYLVLRIVHPRYDTSFGELIDLPYFNSHRFNTVFYQVIAGQGTIGMEILRERNGEALDIVFCCCGGGGLVAGVAAYIKQVRPEVKVRRTRY